MQPEIKLFLYKKLDGVRDYKAGIKACCPFHREDTPSFFVFYAEKLDNWFFKCHGCGESGSLHRLMYKLQGPIELTVKPIYQVNKMDEEKEYEYRPDTTRGLPDIVDYYEYRGIDVDTAKRFKFKTILGPNPACVMPVFFLHRYIGAVRRYLDPGIPYRYELERGCDFSTALFAWDDIDPTEPTLVCEGIIDAAVAWSHGFQALALVTGKKWEPKIDYLRLLDKPICIPDNGDEKSFDAFLNLRKIIGGRLAFLPPDSKDLSGLAMKSPEEVSRFLASLSL